MYPESHQGGKLCSFCVTVLKCCLVGWVEAWNYVSLCSTVYQNVKNLIQLAWKLLSSCWQILQLCFHTFYFLIASTLKFVSELLSSCNGFLFVFSSLGGFLSVLYMFLWVKSFSCRKWRLGLPWESIVLLQGGAGKPREAEPTDPGGLLLWCIFFSPYSNQILEAASLLFEPVSIIIPGQELPLSRCPLPSSPAPQKEEPNAALTSGVVGERFMLGETPRDWGHCGLYDILVSL